MTSVKSGFVLIDKPAGITSHDVIDRLRKITGIKKIGHAGTLDPFATGLLLVAIGREATREIKQFVGLDKTYEAEFVLGATTETLDPEGDIIRDVGARRRLAPTDDEVREAMRHLVGNIKQIPPMHSAIKVRGKKLYELARKGEEIERQPRHVTIHAFNLIGEPRQEDDFTIIDVHIDCSSGTYIRALARDLATEIHTLGYVRTLRRTRIGDFDIKNALKLNELTQEQIFANLSV